MNTIKSIKDLPERIQGDGLRADEYTAYSHHVTLAILNDDDFNKVQNHNVRMVLYSDKYNAIAIHNDRDFIIIRESAFFTTPPKSTVSDKLAEEISQMSDVDFNKGVDELMKFVKPKSTVSAEEIIDKYFKYNDFDKKRVIEAMEEYRNQPLISSDHAEKVNFFLVNILRSLNEQEMKTLHSNIGARISFTPERTAEEEADRLAMKPLPIGWYSEVIHALQLRGIDTSYEESVLNILKGM